MAPMAGVPALLMMAFFGCLPLPVRNGPDQRGVCPEPDPLTCARRLSVGEQWQAVLEVLPDYSCDSAECLFYRGLALSRLDRLGEAKRTFETGRKRTPSDKRFPLELAGVAFRQGAPSESKRQLRNALKMDPGDPYGNDFIATLYFLEGNLEAALKYWNRIGRPQIENVRSDAVVLVDPILLDRAFSFSPASRLTREELRNTEARLDLMGVFPSYRFELVPRTDNKFDLEFHAMAGSGWRTPYLEKALLAFKEIPHQTIHFDLPNLKGSASSLNSFLRWDPQKRRAYVGFSGPFRRDPGSRFRIWLDGRNENWDVLRPESASSLFSFNLKKLDLGAGFHSIVNERWGWESILSLSLRHFTEPPPQNPVLSRFFAQGPVLKYGAAVNRSLLSVPERRLTLQSFGSGQVAKIFREPANRYARLTGGLEFDWLPQARGDDYHLWARLRGGKTLGTSPMDELYELGIQQDSDLYLRGHSATHQGQKGAGPLGRSYILLNCEMDKTIYDRGLWRLGLGPFLDSGKAYDRDVYPTGSSEWLWDAGMQAKISVLRGLTFALSYGRDLRGGGSVFFAGIHARTRISP